MFQADPPVYPEDPEPSRPQRAREAASRAPTPANFQGASYGCEVELTWGESTDDLDPQWIVEYEIYVNDVYDHSLSLRNTRTIVYGTFTGQNTFAVVAVDTAGHKSSAATLALDLDCSF